MTRADWVGVVEAAYRVGGSEEDWLQGVLAAARPMVDRGFGVWGFQFDGFALTRGEIAVSHPASVGLPPDWLDGLRATLAITTQDAMVMHQTVFGIPVHTMSEVLERHPELLGAAQSAIAIPGVFDSLGISARDPSGSGVFIGAHCGKPTRLDNQDKLRFSRIAAHVTSAYRLRRRFRSGTHAALAGEAEAILGPNAKTEHATGAAKSKSALAALKEAAIAADRAAGKLRHQDPDEALRAWEALVAGRWSLLASFDSDGRRLLLAQANEPEPLARAPKLTRRELQVAGYLLLGHSQKIIAYELGLSPGTVSALVARIKTKLKVRSLPALLKALDRMQRES